MRWPLTLTVTLTTLACSAPPAAIRGDDAEREPGDPEVDGDLAGGDDDPTDPPPPIDPGAYLFEPALVHDYYLEIPEASWEGIDAQAMPTGCEALADPNLMGPYDITAPRRYYTGTLRFEDQVFEGVGIRTKGSCGSSRTLYGKPSFKVSLAWDDPDVPGCPIERRLHGLKSLTFNNAVQDWSYVRERLGYALYAAMGVPAPRLAHARLFVNGELFGVYVHLETINRQFLKRWFSSNDGMMYEASYVCDLVPDFIPEGDGESICWQREFDSDACDTPTLDADPTDWSLLRQLADDLATLEEGSFYPEVEAFIDFDTFLSAWAVDSVIAHWDGYPFWMQNNYRVYHDPSSGRFTLLPSGIDQTFKQDQNPWRVGGLLSYRCKIDPECDAAFARKLDAAVATFEALRLGDEAAERFDLIADHVRNDPRREHSYADFVAAHDFLQQFLDERPARVRTLLQERGY